MECAPEFLKELQILWGDNNENEFFGAVRRLLVDYLAIHEGYITESQIMRDMRRVLERVCRNALQNRPLLFLGASDQKVPIIVQILRRLFRDGVVGLKEERGELSFKLLEELKNDVFRSR
jgi:hypothetical protein